MLDKTGLSASKTSILPKNYHISVSGLSQEPYTGAVIRYAITDRSLFSPLVEQARLGAVRRNLADRSLFTPEYALRLRRSPSRDKGQDELIRRCEQLARLGVDFIQLREKDLPPGELTYLGNAILESIRAVGSHTRLLMNVTDDLQPALSIGADGVHLTSKSLENTFTVRKRFKDAGLPVPFVSVSCHTLNEVRCARIREASAILFGPIFGKTVRGEEVQPGIGTGRIGDACVIAWPTPILALGGINAENARACVNAGASGIAAIRMFMLP